MESIAIPIPDQFVEELVERVAAKLGTPAVGPEPWIGVREAAEHMGCSERRVYDLVAQGRIEHGKDGTRLRFRRTALEEYLRGDSADARA